MTADAQAPRAADEDARNDEPGSAENGAGSSRASDADNPGAIAALQGLFAAGRDLGGDVGELAALEARLAAVSGMRMLAVAVVVAVSGASAWFFLQAAAAVALMNHFVVMPSVMLLGFAAANILVCLILALVLLRLSRHLTFAGTRRFFLSGKQHGSSDQTH